MSRRVKRSINGIILLDKPIGLSSNAALQKVKYLLQAKKAGHTGSLDPLATGMLPLCLGEATKFSQYLLNSDKVYQVTAKLGVRTTTSDKEGEIVAEKPVPHLTEQDLEKVLAQFRGEISQVPSMYSALKYNGTPLYKLARQGITVERPARQIHIYRLTLTELTADTFSCEVACSKGTYIRTLIDDIGEVLGCGAHVTALHRTHVGPYDPEKMVTIESLEAAMETSETGYLNFLLPSETSVMHWPPVKLSESKLFYLKQGSSVMSTDPLEPGWVRIEDGMGNFVGVGEVTEDRRIAPRRLVKTTARKPAAS